MGLMNIYASTIVENRSTDPEDGGVTEQHAQVLNNEVSTHSVRLRVCVYIESRK